MSYLERLKRQHNLPQPVPFEGLGGVGGECYYEVLGFRSPSKGEWYLSGAIVEGYKAFSDLTMKYWVVKPTHYARRVWQKGKRVR